jgi:hypothetical protein
VEKDLIEPSTVSTRQLRATRFRLHLPPVDLNRIGAGLVTGAAAGALIGGIGARLAMRVVALLGKGAPSFSIGGTLGILLMGAVLGAIGGLGFALVRWILRLRASAGISSLKNILAGAGYGAILSVLTVLPFFLSPTGELSLASPLVGAALFGWIPLAYGLALGIATPGLERRMAVADHKVGLGWLLAFGMALLLALVGMAPLLGELVSFPRIATDLHYALGLGFQAAHSLHRWIVLGVILVYCGLTSLVFWRGSQNRTARLTAVTLLIFAAGFFGREPVLAGGMQALPLVGLLPRLLQVAGLSLMLVLLVTLPDGRFALRWARPMVVAWCVWSLLWFINPLPDTPLDVSTWPEPLVAGLMILGLGSGLLVMAHRLNESPPDQRRTIRPVLLGFATAWFLFGLLWLASTQMPDLRLSGIELPQALLAFGPYLLPWLLLPLSLVVGIRRGLWNAGEDSLR